MSKYRIVTVIGARPQFVKAAVVSRAIGSRFDETLIHTGQHYDYALSGAFFDQLELPEASHNLAIGSGSQAEQTGATMIRLEPILRSHEPASS